MKQQSSRCFHSADALLLFYFIKSGRYILRTGAPASFASWLIEIDRCNSSCAMQHDLDQGIEEISEERSRFLRAKLRRGILSCEATICWCDETMESGL